MARVRRINVSQIEGDGANNTTTNEIRPYGEMALYQGDNNKLELLIADGLRTNLKNKVLSKGTFYGGDADSADGQGFDTIKLVPDETLRRNGSNQFVIVEPTSGEPGHIHIRAGGTIDQSGADLFIGGEKNNIRVSDTNDRITITTDFDGTSTRTWTFDNNGKIRLPGSSNGVIGEDEPGLVIFSDSNFGILTNTNQLGDSKFWFFENNGGLRLPGTTSIKDTASIVTAGTIITVPLNAAGDTEDYVGGASVLEVPKDADTNQVQAGWIITFSNAVQRTVSGVIDGGSYWQIQYNDANPGLGSSTYPLTIQSANYVESYNGNLTISMDDQYGNPTSFVFGAEGSLALPSNLIISNISILAPVNGTYMAQAPGEWLSIASSSTGGVTQLGWSEYLSAPGNVAIASFNTNNSGAVDISTGSYNATIHTWTFSNAGNLTLPENGTVATVGNIAVQTSGPTVIYGAQAGGFVGGPGAQTFTKSILDMPDISSIQAGWTVTGNNLVGTTTVTNVADVGGDVWEITTDTTQTDPFWYADIYTFTSNTLVQKDWSFGRDGTLTFPGGNVSLLTNGYFGSAAALVGNANSSVLMSTSGQFGLAGMSWFNDPSNIGGTDLAQVLVNSGSVDPGNVQISTGSTDNTVYVWTFDKNGVLTLPLSGDVVNIDGVSQLADRAEGSWTVTAGTNTYSFEVPQNGTYSMWVRGNIPNGIIVWNATATVTNTNVPAIGTQYAWNYTGGGSPLLFTAIPDQIVGTAGAISTDNSYVGATANMFEFDISNSSGSDQTVYWGYTKV